MQKDMDVGALTDAPNENYRKLFEKFELISTLDPKDWKTPQVLGYFVKKYYDTYNVKYKFKFNSMVPSKCFEIFQIKKLSSNLSSDPVILKNYIDWVYANKVIKAKRRLTSISFMTVEGIVNEYKTNVLLNSNKFNNSIDRTTPLPLDYIALFKKCGYELSTYGELAFLNQMSDKSNELSIAFQTIIDNGFDIDLLNKVV